MLSLDNAANLLLFIQCLLLHHLFVYEVWSLFCCVVFNALSLAEEERAACFTFKCLRDGMYIAVSVMCIFLMVP